MKARTYSKIEMLLSAFFSEDEMSKLPYEQWSKEQIEAVCQTLELVIEKEAEYITSEVEACEWLRDIPYPEEPDEKIYKRIRELEEERSSDEQDN